ncbi:MAG: 30S ribosomal protein S4 [Patescibacteria group bacterium]
MPIQQQKSRRPKKLTEYAQQLIEKQKTKQAYGMREKQFRRYFTMAAKFRGKTGEMLLQTLERRLDNVVFRSGLATTRAQARQAVSHRHFTLNGQRVSVPSILVNVKDVIAPHRSDDFTYSPETASADWLKVDKKTGKIVVERLPETGELPLEFDTQKIIEFYSR